MQNFSTILLGIAVGDAFGAGIEFQDRHWIRAHVDFSTYLHTRDNEDGHLYRAGDYTDDAEMTIGLMKAIMAGEAGNPDALVRFWQEEYELGKAQKGFARVGHGSMRWFFVGEQSIEDIRNYQRNKPYPGNAPPMRAVPLGFLPTEQINALAIANADATHPHPKARAASILIARATEFLLVKGGKQSELIAYCLPHIAGIDAETEALLHQIACLPAPADLQEADYSVLCGEQPIRAPRYLPDIYGLPSDAMLTAGAALYLLMHAQDAFDALKNAVWLGGDVDTVASIACGVMAGLRGLDSLPAFLLEGLEGRAYLESVGEAFSTYLRK